MTKPKSESRGLKYLQETRPAAMQHLLKFFGESARHLDPKTRFLISVVTKVIAGSERGMRQYVKRALESGASADEIIDAVLCAYPCAGLTRVVDAIDVVLDMELPEFDPSALGSTRGQPASGERTESPAPAAEERREWRDVAAAEAIPAVGGLRVEVGSREIALFKDGDTLHAIDDTCPHRGASLANGLVIDGEVSCPLHRWIFDLDTGKCKSHPRARVRSYEVRVDDGRVHVLV